MTLLKTDIIVKLEGGDADQHRLPAYAAGEALSGFARAFELSIYYLAEEKIRHRNPKSNKFKVELVNSQDGSFEFVYDIIANIGYFSPIASSIAAAALYDFIKIMLSKVTGREIEAQTDDVKEIIKKHEADLEALSDAIEPSARRFHQVIGEGANNIYVINGDHNKITFNNKTKEFVNSYEIDNEIKGKVFSIGSFNVNSGYGRAFDREEGRTIPFQVLKEAKPDTKVIIAKSLESYASKDNPWIELIYKSILAPNGKVKKIFVIAANEIRE